VQKRSFGVENLDVHTITHDLVFLLQSSEVTVDNFGETVLSGDEDSLAARELELSTTESLLSKWNFVGSGTDGHENGANVHTGRLAKSLSVSVTHTGLESISTGAGKHLVDADHMPWVHSNADMEGFFTAVDLHVLVSGNAGGFEGLRGDLLLLAGNKMDASGVLFPAGLLHTTIVHSDFGVRYTTVEAGLGIGLVFLVSVAT